MKRLLTTALLSLTLLTAQAALRLDECQRLARENYPLIARYDLISQTRDFTLANLKKGYLPQLTLGAQGTLQSDVMSLPSPLQGILTQYEYDFKGLSKGQGRVYLDINQIIYDGGNIRANKTVAKAESEVEQRQNDTDLYAIEERVNDLFFSILLTEEQIQLNQSLQMLLGDNCRKLATLKDGGVAMQSDVDALRAELLNAKQQEVELRHTHEALTDVLSIFIGKDISEPLVKPMPSMPTSDEILRPELSLFDARAASLNAKDDQINASLRPKVSFFAEGYYGYPGYNVFEDMMSRSWSLNGQIGLRFTWNIGSLYTFKNDKRKLQTNLEDIENARQTFLFNLSMQTAQTRSAIRKYQEIMQSDTEIVDLRRNIREAAEAKLDGGVIDVNDLLQEITRENDALIESRVHEIELIKSIYELKNKQNI